MIFRPLFVLGCGLYYGDSLIIILAITIFFHECPKQKPYYDEFYKVK